MPSERREVPALRAEIAARLAERQHGVVARRQLHALGLSSSAVGRWAAELAAGPGAALSHASAAALWEIRPTSATRIDVSVPSTAGRGRRPGLRIHRAAHLQGEEITVQQGIRVTTIARTLLDLSATLGPR